MTNYAERLLDIAKRLDDLAEDGPSELLTISEEIGKIADRMDNGPRPGPDREAEIPPWLLQVRHLIEREAINIVAERYRYQSYGNGSGTVTIQLPPTREEERLRRETIDHFRLYAPSMNASDVLKNINGV